MGFNVKVIFGHFFLFVLGQNSPQFGGKQFVDLRVQYKTPRVKR